MRFESSVRRVLALFVQVLQVTVFLQEEEPRLNCDLDCHALWLATLHQLSRVYRPFISGITLVMSLKFPWGKL